ncbi:MAG TPA: ISAs1 family transposase [Rhodocyclaceae bacterium]|nr:ISAs1 family transposase [Rhodocyclaceae bacterium]
MARGTVVSLFDCLLDVDDPRLPGNGMRYDFREMLVMMIAATLSDCDTVEEMADWARMRESWLRRFLLLKNGIPSEDTFLRLLQILDPKQFADCFRRWMGGMVTGLGRMLAIDGKTARGSAAGGESPLHLVSAFATDLGVALGQEKVADKSNEITAIPELLKALYLRGILVSIDAMGCQKAIARQITAKGGDYLLAVKGNQSSLRESIELAFIDRHESTETHEQLEKSHGRLVIQIARVLPAKKVVNSTDWPKGKTIARIDSLRMESGKSPVSETERRYYISSRELDAAELWHAVRAHWGVENRLHWILDVVFGEDASPMRKDNAPQNLSLLKKIALNLIHTTCPGKAKVSLRIKRKRAAWDDDIRMGMLGIHPR